MQSNPLDVTVRFNFLGDSSSEFQRACEALYNKYSIRVLFYERYDYLNMHTIAAPAVINYRRNSIMQHVYHKGLVHKKYYLDVVVHQDGSLIFQRF